MRLWSLTTAAVTAVGVGVCTWPTRAVAQDFFRVSPGPLAAAHAKWDHADGCVSCHQIGAGIDKVRCLECHDHANLKQTIDAGRGLHSRVSGACTKCHTDHRGRQANIIDWSGVGGRESFDHGRAGYPLQGKHAQIACGACHKRRLRSGDTSFLELSRTCVSCHDNPHGTSFRGKPCGSCHAPSRPWKDNAFDHDSTRFVLRGKHAAVPCSKCHNRPGSKPDRRCVTCHQDTHRQRFAARRCAACHSPEAPTTVRFDHDALTGFPLTAKHERVPCRGCHRGRAPWQFEKLTSTGCTDCHAHQQVHGGQLDPGGCRTCHSPPGGKADLSRFDHQKQTRFALVGAHRRLARGGRCNACHPGNKFRTGKLQCRDCHDDPHRGQLGADCERCHDPRTRFRKPRFDHAAAAGFPLDGPHKRVPCRQCHPQGQYKTGRRRCIDCHANRDRHGGRFGEACERCHAPNGSAEGFDHETMTAFARTGSHSKVACRCCHQPRPDPLPPRGFCSKQPPAELDLRFPVMGSRCADCHRDPHLGAYGNACEICHDTRRFSGAAQPAHEIGAFRLAGAHDGLPCTQCHAAGARLAGTGELCQRCHDEDDVHNSGFGPLCGECHGQNDWRPARFSHAEVGLALRGVHRVMPCDGCHGMGNFLGLDRDCVACHGAEAAACRDPVHTAELDDCARCHTELSFVPARLYHPTFALRGAHVALACADCHAGAVYAGTPSDCIDCHLDDYTRSTGGLDHAAAGLGTFCEDCHQPVSWTPATYLHSGFVLRGAHRVAPCTACHPGQDYGGAFGGQITVWDCGACHGPGGPVDRWPADHDGLGYPTTCELCHGEVSFSPARSPR